jgi:hypothetical protein
MVRLTPAYGRGNTAQNALPCAGHLAPAKAARCAGGADAPPAVAHRAPSSLTARFPRSGAPQEKQPVCTARPEAHAGGAQQPRSHPARAAQPGAGGRGKSSLAGPAGADARLPLGAAGRRTGPRCWRGAFGASNLSPRPHPRQACLDTRHPLCGRAPSAPLGQPKGLSSARAAPASAPAHQALFKD